MNRYLYKDLQINVIDEPGYNYESADNNYNYTKLYFGEGGQNYHASKHGVKIYKDDQEINSCILMAAGGKTCIHQKSSLIDNDQLLICCSDSVFCLSLPELDLRWIVQADLATCFQICILEDDYIAHGEIQITRLDRNGKIKCQFSGADIFVTVTGDGAFRIESDHILLTDFGNTIYKVDFSGKQL